MSAVSPKIFADDRGVWREGALGRPSGIGWDEVYRVGGYKLDAVTEVYTCVYLDWEYGEYVELYDCWPGFRQVASAISERLPGISPDWFARIESLRVGDAPVEVWSRAEPSAAADRGRGCDFAR